MSSVLPWLAAYTAGPAGTFSRPATTTRTPQVTSRMRPHAPAARRAKRPPWSTRPTAMDGRAKAMVQATATGTESRTRSTLALRGFGLDRGPLHDVRLRHDRVGQGLGVADGIQGRGLQGRQRRCARGPGRSRRQRGEPPLVAALALAAVGRGCPGRCAAPAGRPARLRAASSLPRVASAQRQKIILPAVVCSTLVTLTSMVLPSALLAPGPPPPWCRRRGSRRPGPPPCLP